MRRFLVAAVVASLILAVPIASDAKKKRKRLPLRTISCGQVITSSLRAANDLEDCPGIGLSIAASGVTLDLNGHAIDGIAAGAGIAVGGGLSRITIRNGTVTGFAPGIDVPATHRVTVSGITSTQNGSYGIYFEPRRAHS